MTDNINYQAMLERTIAARDGTPSLLLTAAALPAQAMFWSIFPVISK